MLLGIGYLLIVKNYLNFVFLIKIWYDWFYWLVLVFKLLDSLRLVMGYCVIGKLILYLFNCVVNVVFVLCGLWCWCWFWWWWLILFGFELVFFCLFIVCILVLGYSDKCCFGCWCVFWVSGFYVFKCVFGWIC